MSDCDLWDGRLDAAGYGRLKVDGKERLAHRWLWEIANGPIPTGACLLHKCDVRACVNPDHLEIGTRTLNQQQMVERGRSRRGDSHQTGRLKSDQVCEIRRRFAGRKVVNSRTTWGDPNSITNIAKDYGVSYVTIFDIVHRKTWAHLE